MRNQRYPLLRQIPSFTALNISYLPKDVAPYRSWTRRGVTSPHHTKGSPAADASYSTHGHCEDGGSVGAQSLPLPSPQPSLQPSHSDPLRTHHLQTRHSQAKLRLNEQAGGGRGEGASQMAALRFARWRCLACSCRQYASSSSASRIKSSASFTRDRKESLAPRYLSHPIWLSRAI